MPKPSGLNAEQLAILKARYFDYYSEKSQTIPSPQDLAEMWDLEQKATDSQLNRLLRKYGHSVQSVFL